MNTHVPVRLPVCHMHANVYFETRIYIYKCTYVCPNIDRRTYASACIHTYVRTDWWADRQMHRCQHVHWPIAMQIEENIKALRIRKFCFYMIVKNIVFFHLNRQSRPRCRLIQGILLMFFIILKTFHKKKKHILANRNPINIHRPRVKPRMHTFPRISIHPNKQLYIHTSLHKFIHSNNCCTYIHTYIHQFKQKRFVQTDPYIHPYRLIDWFR